MAIQPEPIMLLSGTSLYLVMLVAIMPPRWDIVLCSMRTILQLVSSVTTLPLVMKHCQVRQRLLIILELAVLLSATRYLKDLHPAITIRQAELMLFRTIVRAVRIQHLDSKH